MSEAGLLVFAGGAVLLGWSYLMDAPGLWPIGLSLALAGQAGVLVGLVWQLDRMRRSDKDTTESLDDLDARLVELRQETTRLAARNAGLPNAFHSHLAAGAGPHLLLADLKSQLDLLAVKLAEQQR